MQQIVTTLLDVLACLLLACGVALVCSALIAGLLGIGIGLIAAAVCVTGISLWVSR